MNRSFDVLVAKLASICGRLQEDEQVQAYSTGCEKLANKPNPDIAIQAEQATQNTLFALTTAEKSGKNLQTKVDSIVTQGCGWSEYIARKVLDAVEKTIREGAPMHAAMADAYQRSSDATRTLTAFPRDHPVLCTVIALGMLFILLPAVITWLGFSAEGVVAGSFAARWQSIYGGFVEAGSWFSYFQKLGTIVRSKL